MARGLTELQGHTRKLRQTPVTALADFPRFKAQCYAVLFNTATALVANPAGLVRVFLLQRDDVPPGDQGGQHGVARSPARQSQESPCLLNMAFQ